MLPPTPSANHPPRPRAVLRVGVTGYRPRPEFEVDTPDIRKRARDVLTRIRDGARDFSRNPISGYLGQWEVRVVSALAEGTDRIFAEIALDLGFILEAPLPFSAAEYRKDFKTEASRLEFDRLLGRAARVLELDGAREPGADYGSPSTYGAVGFTIVQNCDLVLALWNGESPEKIGGVAHVASMAALYDLPLIRIDPDDPRVELLEADGGAYRRAFDLDSLNATLADILGPAVIEATGAHRAPVDLREAFLKENPPKLQGVFELFDVLVRWLSGVAPVRPKPPPKDFVAAERAMWEADWKEVDVASPGTRTHVTDALLRPYAWADHLSVHYSRIYRSSYTLLYTLAVCAIAWAVGSWYLPAFFTEEVGPRFARLHLGSEQTLVAVANGLKLACLMGELVALALISVVYRFNRKHLTHEKWVDYRTVAELLRHHRFLLPLGRTSGLMAVLDRRGFPDVSSTWVTWYSRAVVRTAGLTPVHMCTEYLSACARILRANEIGAQANFHVAMSHRFTKTSHRLHGLASFFDRFVVVVVALELILAMLQLEWRFPLVLTVLLPVAAVHIHVFIMQSDFDTSALRANRIQQQLKNIEEELASITVPSSFTLGTIADSAAAVMASELSDWRSDARARPIPLAF